MSAEVDSGLPRGIDRERDHVRAGSAPGKTATIVYYGDFLCPYCRRLRVVLKRLRGATGDRIVYAYRHFPNERAHPGAEFMARASEAAANQGRFWEMYDRLFDEEKPLDEERARLIAREIGLDETRFDADLDSEDVRRRLAEHLAAARRDGVSGTPTLFIDGVRYDGAWDYYSLLDAIEQPVAERIHRSARAFANLPATGGLVLVLAGIVALAMANSPLAAAYVAFIHQPFGIGPVGTPLSLTVGEWFSEGLLSFLFLLVGLGIRREMTAGAMTDRGAATLPVIAAFVASIVPALIYLVINRGAHASGWAIPTATDIAFALGILALLGERVPGSLRVFVAAFAVVDDVISVLVLGIFYAHNFDAVWLLAAVGAIGTMFVLKGWRVRAIWPYAVTSVALWLFFHATGVHGALAGIVLAAFLPRRPAPAAAPLLAQAATALAALEHAQSDPEVEDKESVVEWASRNLSAASDRLLSPADRVEQAVGPWSTYVVLPLFAFSATGIALNIDLSSPGSAGILWGVILGLVIGKPLGICAAAWFAVSTGIGRLPEAVGFRPFIGAACLCGIGDTVALLIADQAFPAEPGVAAIAKVGVLAASVLSSMLGAAIILTGPAVARSEA